MKTKKAFWDTSAIVPLCCFQDKSQKLRELGRNYEVVAWWATSVEALSALKRLAGQNAISANAYKESVKRLEIHKASWYEVLPTENLRNIATDLIETADLRTLDALQLASALVWCFEKPKGRIFVSCDNKLSESAARLGFTVLPS